MATLGGYPFKVGQKYGDMSQARQIEHYAFLVANITGIEHGIVGSDTSLLPAL